MIVTKNDIEHFQAHGWVTVQMGIDKPSLSRYIYALRKMRAKAIASDYQFRRVWWDYIDSDNVAALELPFNKIICDKYVHELFSYIDLGKTVNNIMGWENSYCSLARLFCMNNYKYRGNWHRDFTSFMPNTKELNSVQIAIYLQDQPGFRLLKKEYDLKYFSNVEVERAFIEYNNPLNLPKESYTEIPGRAGSILIFNPSMFHQGSSFNERLDFHMRFNSLGSKSQEYPIVYDENLKFHTYNFLSVDVDYSVVALPKNIPREKRSTMLRKILNTINYNTAILNLVRWLRFRKRYASLKSSIQVSTDLWANTLFQK